jgi:hypothetical protein
MRSTKGPALRVKANGVLPRGPRSGWGEVPDGCLTPYDSVRAGSDGGKGRELAEALETT